MTAPTPDVTAPAPAPTSDPGRWIRFALIMLPVGTILLGIASFGIWQWKKDQAADRSFKYALALRRSISAEGIERHAAILRTALAKPDRDLSLPGYLESTMGPENMGYTVRRQRFGPGISNASTTTANNPTAPGDTPAQAIIDAELTGTKRPLEVVMLLSLYSSSTEPQQIDTTAQAFAESLAIAHEITGEKVVRSLRFAFLPDTPAALKELKDSLQRDGERLLHLFILGGPEVASIDAITRALDTTAKGTRVLSLPATKTAQDTLQSALPLKAMLLDAAEIP